MGKVWTLETLNTIKVVEAEDQWEAYDSLKDLPPEEFGLIVVAKPEKGKKGEEILVRTSFLFGKRWNRPDVAHAFIVRAIMEGLPDTTKTDIKGGNQ